MNESTFAHPFYLNSLGQPVYEPHETETSSLHGIYLDFYYAHASGEFKEITLYFMPSGHPYQITAKSITDSTPFERTATEEEMQQKIRQEFGDRVTTWTLKI